MFIFYNKSLNNYHLPFVTPEHWELSSEKKIALNWSAYFDSCKTVILATLMAMKHDQMEVETVYLLRNYCWSSPIENFCDNFEEFILKS
jgi:hypothetical protein